MTETLETKPKFKKQFLYRDEKRITETLKQFNEWADYLETGLAEALLLFDDPLTKDEKIEILANGWKGAETLLRSKSKFPKGDIDTVLGLEGKNAERARAALKMVPARYASVGYTFEGDSIVLSEQAKTELINENTFYTNSEKQNEALRLAKEFCKTFEDAVSLGLLTNLDRLPIANNLSKLVLSGLNEKGEISLLPHLERIKQIF